MDRHGDDHDDDLEQLVCDCLDAADPVAELQRRAADRPGLLAAGLRLLQQVSRLERLDVHDLAGTQPTPPGPRADDRSTWPSIPGVELETLIGRGGQGFVYRGKQTYLRRPVAVKVLAPELQTAAFVERFGREARLLAGLQHPHIVTCHDAGVTATGECYLVMELIDGPNLQQWFARHGALPLRDAVQLLSDLAAALEHAQQQGFVHRDVKPENVLLQPRADAGDAAFAFVPKLADLGLARPAARGAGLTMLTPVGAVVGTPVTMAPEQFDAPEQVDHRADIYGLGCILHHALVGRAPFRGTAMTDLVMQKADLRDPAARAPLPGVPTALSTLVWRMLAWAPADRPQSYAELRAALTAAAPAEATTGRAIRSRRWLLAASAAGLAAIVWFAWPRHDAPAAPPTAAEIVVAAPATLVEGTTATIGWSFPGAVPATGLHCAQTAGPQVLLRAITPTSCDFELPLGVAGSDVTFVISAADGGPPTRTVKIAALASPARAPLAAGADEDLFPGGVIASWQTNEASRWAADEFGRGVVVNTPRDFTGATRTLPDGDFVLRGKIEPRFRYVSVEQPHVPIADVGWRLELGGHDALALSISALGGDRFGARWQRQRLDGPTWQTTAELGSCAGTFPTGEPLQFVVRWSGGALRASCGPPGAPDAALAEVKPATDWQVPWRPGRLQLRADRGVAVFTDWRLAATDR